MSEDFKTPLEQAKAARRETIAKFRFEQVKELPEPLPVSGLTVFARDISIMDLIFSGKLPEPLVEVLSDLAEKGEKEFDLKKFARNGDEFRQMVDGLILIGVIEPPIAEKGDDDHIGISEIAADDRMAIYNWFNREVKGLQPFRGQQDQPVSAVQHGDGIRSETESVS